MFIFSWKDTVDFEFTLSEQKKNMIRILLEPREDNYFIVPIETLDVDRADLPKIMEFLVHAQQSAEQKNVAHATIILDYQSKMAEISKYFFNGLKECPGCQVVYTRTMPYQYDSIGILRLLVYL